MDTNTKNNQTTSDDLKSSELQGIADFLNSSEWKLLGRTLGVPDEELNLIKYNERSANLNEISYQMLRRWRQAKGSEANRSQLINGLREIGRIDIVERVFLATLPATVRGSSIKSQTFSKFPNDFKGKIQTIQRKKYSNILLPNIAWLKKKWSLEQLYVDLTLNPKGMLGEEENGQKINLEEIFLDIDENKTNRILIEGAPGYGKTTLACKILYDWAKQKEYVSIPFFLAFMISLRNFNGNLENSLGDQIGLEQIYLPSQKKNFILTEQSRILLILDGFDELTEKMKKELQPYLRCERYPAMTIVVTSRSGQFQLESSEKEPYHYSIWSKRIMIQGISEEKRKEFLQKYLETSVDEVYEQLPYLIKPETRDMYQCPLFLILIATLIEDGKTKEISSKTDLYKRLFNFLLRRSVLREPQIFRCMCGVKKASDRNAEIDVFRYMKRKVKKRKKILSPELEYYLYKVLLKFGKFSLQMLKEKRFCFEKAEILKLCKHNVTILNLGFLVENVTFLCHSEESFFEPIHKTFLEFLAAVYLTHMANTLPESSDVFNSEIKQLLDSNLEQTNYSLLFSFLGGLMGSKTMLLLRALTSSGNFHFNALGKIFMEMERTEEIQKFILPLIPVYYVIENDENYFLKFGIAMKRIQIIEFHLDHVIDLPENEYRLKALILDTDKINQKGLISLQEKSIRCNHLVCHFRDKTEKYLDEIASIISSIVADKITFYVYNSATVNNLSLIKNELLMNNICKNMKIYRLIIYLKQCDESYLLLLKDLLITGVIEQGLFMYITGNLKHDACTEIHYTASIQEILNSLYNVSEFHLLSNDELVTCNGCAQRIGKQFKYLGVANNIILKNGIKSNRLLRNVPTIPLQALSLANVSFNLTRNYLDTIELCESITGLDCFDEQFECIAKHVNKNWPGYQSLEVLHYRSSFKTKSISFDSNIYKMKNLKVLVIEANMVVCKDFINNFFQLAECSLLKELKVKNLNVGLENIKQIVNILIGMDDWDKSSERAKSAERSSAMCWYLPSRRKLSLNNRLHLEEIKLEFIGSTSVFHSHIYSLSTLLKLNAFKKVSLLSVSSFVYSAFQSELLGYSISVEEEIEEESLISQSIFRSNGNFIRKLVIQM